MRFLLDTNICIYVINRKPRSVVARFRRYPVGEIGISSITAAKLAFGVTKSGSERNRDALLKFLAPLEIVPFSGEAIWQYGHVRTTLERAGTPIGALDTLIAPHALTLDAMLVSNNLKEFSRVEELRCENWIDPPEAGPTTT